jgi:hypothetical protein
VFEGGGTDLIRPLGEYSGRGQAVSRIYVSKKQVF